jgi:hypothetical protein
MPWFIQRGGDRFDQGGDRPNEILIWQPAPEPCCIQDVLRHVAGAERWYLTRILNPTTIPSFKLCEPVWQRLETG